jgi:hypothetical protein
MDYSEPGILIKARARAKGREELMAHIEIPNTCTTG